MHTFLVVCIFFCIFAGEMSDSGEEWLNNNAVGHCGILC